MDLPPPGFPCPFPSTPVLPAKVSAFPGLLSYWPHILQLAGSSASHLSPESFLIFCSLGAWLHPFPLSASGEWRDKYILNPPCWIWNLDGVFLCISEKKKIQNNRCKAFLLSVLNYLRAGKMKGGICLHAWRAEFSPRDPHGGGEKQRPPLAVVGKQCWLGLPELLTVKDVGTRGILKTNNCQGHRLEEEYLIRVHEAL